MIEVLLDLDDDPSKSSNGKLSELVSEHSALQADVKLLGYHLAILQNYLFSHWPEDALNRTIKWWFCMRIAGWSAMPIAGGDAMLNGGGLNANTQHCENLRSAVSFASTAGAKGGAKPAMRRIRQRGSSESPRLS